MANHREMSRGRWKRVDAGVYIKTPHHALTVITEKGDPSLVTQGWVGDKPCLMTMDTGAYETMAQNTAEPTLRTADSIWRSLPLLKEVFLTLVLGRCPFKTWVFVTSITNEFILGLDILCAYDASVDIGRQTLHLAEEEVFTMEPQPSSLVVAKDQVIRMQCKGIVIARLESPLRVGNGPVEPSPEGHLPEGLCIAWNLVHDCWEVPVRVLNATHRDQKLMKGFSLAN
jgi:hypothetical protein